MDRKLTLEEYVVQRIRDIFTEIAEMVGDGEIDVSEDEAAGVPFALMEAEHTLIEAWQHYQQIKKEN